MAPIFVKQAVIEYNEDEDKATVTCKVHGIPTPSLQWYRDTKEVIPSDTLEIFYDENTGEACLEISDVRQNEILKFSIQISNEFGKAVCVADVITSIKNKLKTKEILKAPSLTPLNTQIIPIGATLKLESKFEGFPTPTIKWLRNGQEIKENNNISITTKDNTSILKIQNVDRKRTGKYEVCAINKLGETKVSASVVVSDTPQDKNYLAPQFTELLYPKFVEENDVAIVEVKVESNPLSSFQWFFNFMPFESSNEVRIMTDNNKSVLLIDNFTKEHVGSYTCRAENICGSVTSSATINLLAHHETEEVKEFISPVFTKQLIPVEIMDGEKLVLECEVAGIPTPKVIWYHDGKIIESTKDKTMLQDVKGNCILTITEVFPEDAGEYVCYATNRIGDALTKTTVNIQGIKIV